MNFVTPAPPLNPEGTHTHLVQKSVRNGTSFRCEVRHFFGWRDGFSGGAGVTEAYLQKARIRIFKEADQELLWDCFGISLGFLWDSFGIPLGLLWDCFEIALRLLCG